MREGGRQKSSGVNLKPALAGTTRDQRTMLGSESVSVHGRHRKNGPKFLSSFSATLNFLLTSFKRETLCISLQYFYLITVVLD